MKCCFFHFIKNLRDKMKDVVNSIKNAEGERSDAFKLAQRTKRRFMMVPLLPEELVTLEIVDLILRAWKDGCPNHADAFDAVSKSFMETYVGRRRKRSRTVGPPRFPPSLWSVSGMRARTNNPAERVHSKMNEEVKGPLSLRL